MEFFIARKVRPVFEVYRQVFHKVANSVRSSEPVLTSSFDISNLTGRPHPTIMKDIRKILEQGAGADDFFKTYRPVETECGTRDYEAYNITPKGLLILATGYAPLLRDRIAAIYAGITGGGSAHVSVQPPLREPNGKAGHSGNGAGEKGIRNRPHGRKHGYAAGNGVSEGTHQANGETAPPYRPVPRHTQRGHLQAVPAIP